MNRESDTDWKRHQKQQVHHGNVRFVPMTMKIATKGVELTMKLCYRLTPLKMKSIRRFSHPLFLRITAIPIPRCSTATAALYVFLLLWQPPAISAAPARTIARDWNEECLAAIRIDTPHPPAQARNLFSLAVCMYDAWAAYTNTPVGYIYRGKHTANDIPAARREAISYAAYRILRERYVYSRSASNTLARLDAHMASLGYDTNNFSTDTSTAAGVGNSVYAAVSAWFINDGARQTNAQGVAYADFPTRQGGYVYINDPLPAGQPGISVKDVNRWQRLQIVNAVDQNGFPQGPIQTYLGAIWLAVRPFAMNREESGQLWIDPGPPPRLGATSDAEFRSNVVEVIRRSSQLTPDDGVTMDISPGAFGNNTLGQNDGTGRPLNPATQMPYPPNIVKRGDFARVLAEFWADGPSSETPPGHWNVLANNVADDTNFVKQIEGTGPVVDDLEWDVKVYFALNAATHEAACAAWSIKRFYDGWRPISAIRYMGQLGQSSDPTARSYYTNGLPLIPGLIELVTSDTVTAGRHRGLTPGKIALLSWPGQPVIPSSKYQGVKWIHADSWIPYQRTNFVTPAFPGYISGHSTFSRAAAEVLTAITGTPFFPGGLATYTAVADIALGFEKGPSETVQLQWATYFDAADQAGLSRIWGGIHPPVDDFGGRRVGSECGKGVWALAKSYFDGSVTETPVSLALRPLDQNSHAVHWNTLRGFYYKLQSTTNIGEPFLDESAQSIQALEGSMTVTNGLNGKSRFYRALASPLP